MLTANSTRLVGPILSCEREVHIQSWTQLIDWRVMDTVLPIMSATCEPGIDWDSVIDKEVAIGVTLLREGFSLAGLHPNCRVFSLEDREKLHEQDPNTVRELSWCKNILRADVSNFLNRLIILDVHGFVKFGGTLWREGLLPESFVNRVNTETHIRYGMSYAPQCYRQMKGRGM